MLDIRVQRSDLLLLVVRGIRKYTRIKMTLNTVATFNHHSMFVRFQEFVVKDDCPLGMVDFSLTVGHEDIVWTLAANMFCGEGFKCIWKLLLRVENCIYKSKSMSRHSPSPSRQYVQMLDMLALTFYPSTHFPS